MAKIFFAGQAVLNSHDMQEHWLVPIDFEVGGVQIRVFLEVALDPKKPKLYGVAISGFGLVEKESEG